MFWAFLTRRDQDRLISNTKRIRRWRLPNNLSHHSFHQASHRTTHRYHQQVLEDPVQAALDVQVQAINPTHQPKCPASLHTSNNTKERDHFRGLQANMGANQATRFLVICNHQLHSFHQYPCLEVLVQTQPSLLQYLLLAPAMITDLQCRH